MSLANRVDSFGLELGTPGGARPRRFDQNRQRVWLKVSPFLNPKAFRARTS